LTNDVDLAQDLDRRAQLLDAVLDDRLLDFVAVEQAMDAPGGGRHALVEQPVREQGVDEGALAGVELANHHQQEELVELANRLLERRLVFTLRAVAGERGLQVAQALALFGEENGLAGREDALQHDG
jgi:hypothetical protein